MHSRRNANRGGKAGKGSRNESGLLAWSGTSAFAGPNCGVAPGALSAPADRAREWHIAAAPDGVPWVRLYGDGKPWCMSPHNGWLGMVE